MTEEKSPSVQQSRVERSHFCMYSLGIACQNLDGGSLSSRYGQQNVNNWKMFGLTEFILDDGFKKLCVKMKAKCRVGDVVEQ